MPHKWHNRFGSVSQQPILGDFCYLVIDSWRSVSHSVMLDSVTPRTVAHQAPMSMEFFRQEYWSKGHSLLQGIFLTLGSNLGLPNNLYHISPNRETSSSLGRDYQMSIIKLDSWLCCYFWEKLITLAQLNSVFVVVGFFVFYFYFSASQLVGSWFSHQGLNLGPR